VIVGGAGSGKTHLLSWLASTASHVRPAVRVRLADVQISPGRPETILRVWARSARSHAEVDVSDSVLIQGKLHFLFDGLDEVPGRDQAVTAALISEIAKRFPQHAFTIASRPVPALAEFSIGTSSDRGVWRIVNLVPGNGFQQRYLGHAA
jgi:hypothetical protein